MGALSASIIFFKLSEGTVLPDAISEIALKSGIKLAQITAIGGFGEARIAVYDAANKEYHYINVAPYEGHILEVVALNGNVACFEGKCYPHIHVVLARKPGEVYAGHLLYAKVNPLLELFMIPVSLGDHELKELFGHRAAGIRARALE